MIRLVNGLGERHVAPLPDFSREPATFDMSAPKVSNDVIGERDREPLGQQQL